MHTSGGGLLQVAAADGRHLTAFPDLLEPWHMEIDEAGRDWDF